jgi:hypothetical protein
MDMVMQHHQHLREKRDHLKQAATQATRQVGQQDGPANSTAGALARGRVSRGVL